MVNPSAVEWLDKVRWDANGLVPVIAQEASTNDVLMFAWMNREALAKTIETGRAVYFSRSRRRLWFKGEESGHVQHVHEVRLDCDEDVVLLKVEQVSGIACHTGRHSCFYRAVATGKGKAGEDAELSLVDAEKLFDPAAVYGKHS